jgi:hypothetical protein
VSAAEPREPEYWAEVEAAWEGRSERPAPRQLGRMRGGVLAAMMLGLQEALEPREHDEVVVEVDVDQEPRAVGGVVLHFDPTSPCRTVAVVEGVTPPP